MTFLIITALVFLGTLVWYRRSRDDFFPFLSALLSGIVLFIGLILVPANRSDISGQIAKFKALKQTVEISRGRIDQIERFALTKEIIEANSWLAEKQYYNGTGWDIYIPDEVDTLKPIE